MDRTVRTGQLLIFTINNRKPEILLNDTIGYDPGYRISDVIHLLHPPDQHNQFRTDRQYVVLDTKHVLLTGDPDRVSGRYILLVEVAELAEAEQTGLGVSIHTLLKSMS